LVVALFTVIIKVILTMITNRFGRQTNNPAVIALAYDHRNDVLAALAVSIGIFLGRAGYYWVDPLAGALVAIVILSTGIQILRQSSADLMDNVPGKALQKQVVQTLENIDGVEQVEEILSHRFGPYLVINITIGVKGSLNVREGDEIATQVEEKLYQEINLLKRVHVHYHPVIN